jgi:hypothetical protein
MFQRPALFFGVLLAAVVVPYVLLDEHLAQSAGAVWSRFAGTPKPKHDEALAKLPDLAQAAATKSAAPMRSPTIEEAFRFDLTPEWVGAHWPRVSTVLGGPKQLGMRVAYASGTGRDDVAGSLTYYFSEHHQLERLTFTGLTGDPRRLLAATVTPHGLKSQPTTHAAHYLSGDPQHPTSEVIVRHLAMLEAEQTQRAEVSVDLRRGDVLGWRERAEREADIKLLPSSYRRW